jgi:8-oxo-dGTP diphosphatase
MPPITVTCGIIRRDNQILIAQRKPTSFFEANKWEFPGGKLEPNESPERCLEREIKEELGMIISVNSLFSVQSHTYEKDSKTLDVILMAFEADHIQGENTNLDCQDSRWIEMEDLSDFDFAEADKAIVTKLLKS